MSIATSYHTSYSWTCTSSNPAYLENWVKPSYVTTAGTYTCMPYCWGGFDDQSGYETKLANGYRVGQATSTYPWNTCGLDCAGYVSRCWNLDEHHYTLALYDVSTDIDFDELQSGDALNSTNHVMLFDYYNNSNGTYILYECTTTSDYDRVAHTIRTATSVESTYTPIKYDYTDD